MRSLNSGRQLSNDEIAQMVAKYREVRRRVWNEATRAPEDSATAQTRNQAKLRAAISDVCDRARVDRYVGAGEDAARLLWRGKTSPARHMGRKRPQRGHQQRVAGLPHDRMARPGPAIRLATI
jgi:hypothetical protein